MKQETPTHRKIRFRRGEIADLASLPSADATAPHWRRGRRAQQIRHLSKVSLALATFLLVFTAASLYVVLAFGWGTDALRARAEHTLQKAIGPGMAARVGPASIALGLMQPVSVSFGGFELSDSAAGGPMLHADQIRFGIQLLPLLAGDLRLGEASVAGVRIDVAALPSRGEGLWYAGLVDERGLIDPDRIATAVFGALEQAFDVVDRGLAERIALSDIELRLPPTAVVPSIVISSADIRREGAGSLSIAGLVKVENRSISIGGTAARDPVTHLISDLDLVVTGEERPSTGDGDRIPPIQLGAFSVALTGRQQAAAPTAVLRLDAKSDAVTLDFGARGQMAGSLDLQASLAEGTDKLEINRLAIRSDRTVLDLNGAFGPKPPTPGEPPRYRYELLTQHSEIAPEASPEQALAFKAQVEGTYDPASGLMDMPVIALTGGTGQASARAQVTLERGKAPGIVFTLAADGMPMAHAKQLWPWFAAGRTRQWVFDHVFGGKVDAGQITFKVQPGRLGNGVPLSGEEITGRFDVSGARFDTAGLIPPVREAVGRIDINGHDVNVSLDSGTVYLPSGKVVAGRNGILDVRRAVRDGQVGQLEIDVEGEAGAIAELASFEPINALRRLPIAPEDLSGSVKGHVSAEIPLRKEVDRRTLDWHVTLGYQGLTLAKPLGTQTLSDADGTIDIVPDRLTLDAKGKLNGIPAELKLVEPLRETGPPRRRDVTLVVDDAARAKMAPGLDTIISGTMRLEVDDEGAGVRQIIADLTGASVGLPWIGWSKGPGVAAVAQFTMRSADGRITLSDFSMTGDSFSADGNLVVAGGRLESAKFDKVRLNRSDDVKVDVKGAGKGYSIAVKGKTLDARSLIQTFVGGTGSSQKRGKAGGGPVSVSLDVERVSGFGDETMSGVELSVATEGGRLGTMRFAGTTASGAVIQASNGEEAGRSTLRMQSGDAGAVLRFLDLYPRMTGGTIQLALARGADGTMTGQVDARNFVVVDEPQLASLVSTTPAGADRSLNQAVKQDIDTSRVQFDRGYAQIAKGDGFLRLARGVLRGPLIGTTFQGTLYDESGRMDMTGTFLPAYGINSLFGDIPVLGALLGNGRDGALLGVTYKLTGAAKAPQLTVNPLSIIAPGIFRSIFEF